MDIVQNEQKEIFDAVNAIEIQGQVIRIMLDGIINQITGEEEVK